METAGSAREEPAVSPADLSAGALSLVERFQTLLAIAGSVTSCRDPEELFRLLARQLQRVVRFDRLGLVLLQPERGVTSARVLETTGMHFTTLPEYPVHGNHSGWVIETQQPLIVPDTAAEPPTGIRRPTCLRPSLDLAAAAWTTRSSLSLS